MYSYLVFVIIFIYVNYIIFYNFPDILLITFNDVILLYNKRSKHFFRNNLLNVPFKDLIVNKNSLSEFEMKTSNNIIKYVKIYFKKICYIKLIRLIDITIHKKRHNQLIEKNDQLDYFIYKSSHDLKSPVASMKGLLNLISIDEKNKDKYLDLMKESIEYMDNNINNISNFQKTEEFDLKYDLICLYDLIEYIIKHIKFSKKSIIIKNNVDKKVYIRSDRFIMISIIQNILSNSFKYSDKNKSENIVVINYKLDNGNHILSFWDNGIGISKDNLPKIGEIFYTINKVSHSTGLGMFILKKSLEKLNGTLSINSVEKEYTTFKVVLPII